MRRLDVPSRPLRATVAVDLWTPPGVADGTPLPLLVVHDGPEYEGQSALTERASGWIAGGRVPAHRIALLHAGAREEWYSASALYARALANEVLPALGRAVAVAGAPVGMGASLGGLAMLHAQRRYPAAFGALFLQSGSFFQPRFDRTESSFRRYLRIVRFTGRVLRAADGPPVTTVLTCGLVEENLYNNRDITAALRRQIGRAHV